MTNKIPGLEKTWRWFGPNDPFSLKEIKQTGATGIVTALHQIPTGEVWPEEEILKRKQMIESEGLTWSVTESIIVHEDIKKREKNYKKYIENYKQTIINLGKCGIDIVCYNFMPVLDWSRTDLHAVYNDGSVTTKFEAKVFAAFDLFILKRKNAEKDYTTEQLSTAKEYYERMDENQKQKLLEIVLLGLPGSLEAYTLEDFKKRVDEYQDLPEQDVRNNLYYFIREITAAAEESGVLLGIHPDDPARKLLGLPRIVGNKKDIQQILNAADSPNNGITLCTGSYGAEYSNDCVEIAEKFAERINFIHLRNVFRNKEGDFMESDHLNGDVDMYNVMKTILFEQKRRIEEGRKDIRMPMRPDHGRLMIPDMNRKGIYPGYSLFGRMRGLAELRGLEMGIINSLGL